MTCLISWASVDSRGPSAVYVGADSRISWGETGKTWDIGQKVFCCKRSADIFGYSGDVLFATQVLSKAVELADSGILFDARQEPADKFNRLSEFVKESFTVHPKYPQIPEFEIIYCTRKDGPPGEVQQFFVYSLSYMRRSDWLETVYQVPQISMPIAVSGSGAESFNDLYGKNARYLKGISRGVFLTLCDVITKGLDKKSGGQPQLVALYREGNGRAIGTIFNNKRFFYGAEIARPYSAVAVEWRNENFERCDGETLQLLYGAQKQPRPPELDLNLAEVRHRAATNFLRSIGRYLIGG